MSDPNRQGHPSPVGGGWWRRLLRALGLRRGSDTACSRPLTPDEDLQIAFRASADGDLQHAAFHAACVIKASPADTRGTKLLERLVDKSIAQGLDPLDLAPLGTGKRGTYAGVVAARSYILAHQQRWAEAIELLRQLAHADPATPWWKWAFDWLARPGVAQQADPAMITGLLASAVNFHGAEQPADPDARAALEAALPAAIAAVEAHPKDELLRLIHVMIARKSGRRDEACRLAEAFWREMPSQQSGVARGMARKINGDMEGAIAAFEEALPYAPTDESMRADLAEFNCALGRFDEALRWAEETKRRDAQRRTSAWTLWYLLKHRAEPNGNWMQEFQHYREANPNCRMPGQEVLWRLGAWEAEIPAAAEATINVVKQVLEKLTEPAKTEGTVTLHVTCLESPSSHLAARRALGRFNVRIALAVEQVPTPDPRVPAGIARWPTWQYDGIEPSTALPAPSPLVSQGVAALAAEPYDLQKWWQTAGELAAGLIAAAGMSFEALAQELIGAMLHPTEPPRGVAEWDWTRATQVAAALVVGRIDDGWTPSVRRDALQSLLHGPTDWITEAALAALVCIFREKTTTPDARADIENLLRALAHRLPDQGHCSWCDSLSWAVRCVAGERTQPLPGFEALWDRAKER
jgi:tetratricopeptide (TPR) repeat protein